MKTPAECQDDHSIDAVKLEVEIPKPHTEARLPVELERHIFEIVACERPFRQFHVLPNLMLVARRVYHWIKPILYNVMTISSPTGRNYPPTHRIDGDDSPNPLYTQYGKYVRNLMLDHTGMDKALDILRYCPNTQNIALWVDNFRRHAEFLELIRPIPIQRLSVSVQRLSQRYHDSDKLSIDPTVFTGLTHLEMIGVDTKSSLWQEWQTLTFIPTLTHLAIDDYTPESIQQILKQSSNLQVLILLLNPWQGRDDYARSAKACNDERVVARLAIMLLDLWERGAHGESDLWVWGEAQMKKRVPLVKQFADLARGLE